MLPGKKYGPLDIAGMAWRRRWMILVGVIVGIYAALIVSSRRRDLYQSEMQIQVVPQSVPRDYVQSTVTTGASDRLNALSQQVTSRTALERLIVEMNLYPEERARLPLQDVVERMRTQIVLQLVNVRNRPVDAFYVRFTYPDAQIATRVTERLGGLFIDMNVRDRGQLAEATNEFLESQLATVRGTLEEQERKLERFRLQNAGRLPTQLNFNMQALQNTQQSLQSLGEALARDRDRKLMLERLYREVEPEVVVTASSRVQTGESLQGGAAASTGQPVAQQLQTARNALAALELRLTPSHPDIGRARRTVEELEKRVAAEAAAHVPTPEAPLLPAAATPTQIARHERLRQMRLDIENLERQIAFKEAEEQRLRGVLTEYQQRIEQIPGVESEWVSLTRDYETYQAAYNNLLSKNEQSKVAIELERRQISEQFRVLDPARVPTRPTGLGRLQVNAIGAAAGLALGLALAALVEIRDKTFHSGNDVIEVLKLPVMAQVPYMIVEPDRRVRRRRRLMMSGAVAVVLIAGGYGFWVLELWKYVA